MFSQKSMRGVSLIDAIVGSALMLIIFMSLVGLMRSSLQVASLAKTKAGATAVANTQMEYIRSLPYDQVGTVGGIPAGLIPQNATSTQNSIDYGVRTFIEYVDDPADGTGASDTNGITTDYKRIKISVTYSIRGVQRKLDMVSNYVPPSIETSTNGGTLKVVVVSSTGSPVPGATVHVVNVSTTPGVDLTTFSDSTGVVLLGGAATSTEYQVYVSKNGYSSAQTYARDTTNQNPTPGYLTVVKNQTTTSTFAIDTLATLTLRTLYPIVATSTTDSFTDSSKTASQNNLVRSSGSLILDSDSSGYFLNGFSRSIAITPGYLFAWTTASTTIVAPSGTSIRVQVLDASGALIPDASLPGNSAGFTGTSIDLSGIATSTYPALSLKANFTTTSTTTTPSLNSWSINSLVGPIPVPNVSISLAGAKTIGSTGAGTPIYKTTLASTTGVLGAVALPLEWDTYALTLPAFDVINACDAPAYAVSAGASYADALYLGTLTSNSVLITVRDSSGNPVTGATVTLSRTGYSSAVNTTSCGTAYFGGITNSTSYTVQISKTGFTTTTYSNVSLSGHIFYATSFP